MRIAVVQTQEAYERSRFGAHRIRSQSELSSCGSPVSGGEAVMSGERILIRRIFPKSFT